MLQLTSHQKCIVKGDFVSIWHVCLFCNCPIFSRWFLIGFSHWGFPKGTRKWFSLGWSVVRIHTNTFNQADIIMVLFNELNEMRGQNKTGLHLILPCATFCSFFLMMIYQKSIVQLFLFFINIPIRVLAILLLITL